MSYADLQFKGLCGRILLHGESSEGQDVRPRWQDGVPAHTISIFSHTTKYDLAKEFPLITVRPTNFKAALDEILWIYQKKSNDVRDLNSHIWDQWADDEGTIGLSYGAQMGKEYHFPQGKMDQVDNVLWQLKNTPSSRRIMWSMYSCKDAPYKALQECAYECIFGVKQGKLDMMLIQRSQDVLVANNWNVSQYAALQLMIAQVSDLEPGTLTHVIADAHIYDRHIPIVEDLLERDSLKAPKVTLDPSIKNFYDFTVDSFEVEGYQTQPQIKSIPVAI